MRVIHIIYSLDTGGAESMLIRLVEQSPQSFEHIIYTLAPHKERAQQLIKKGYKVQQISWFSFFKKLNQAKGDAIMGWLFHGMVLSALYKKFFNKKQKVIWNIRYSYFPTTAKKEKNIVNFLKPMSYWVDGIIYNSHIGKKTHDDLGYNTQNSIVINNGFELEKFHPRTEEKTKNRRELELPEAAFIFGMVGRFNSLKNQKIFIEYALEYLDGLKNENKKIYFVFVGRQMNLDNPDILKLIENHNFQKRFLFLGEQQRLENIYPSFDIHCLYSTTEGFPNVVGEAMSCGIPCITSDTGDVKNLMGSTGWLVPINDKKSLFYAFDQAYQLGELKLQEMGKLCRKRIESEFAISNIIQKYCDYLETH